MYNSEIKHECGVIGIYDANAEPRSCSVALKIRIALQGLQHRGEESWGAATFCDNEVHIERRMGYVLGGFTDECTARLPGRYGIGQTRYSTSGASVLYNVQPLVFDSRAGKFALAHNGNISNADELKHEMKQNGHSFTTTSDSEIIGRLVGEHDNITDGLQSTARQLRAAYSLTLLTENGICGARDPLGIRPLCIGKRNGVYAIASEPCVFNDLGLDFHRDVEPGEMVFIGSGGEQSLELTEKPDFCAHCIFEPVYFADRVSIIDGIPVDAFRVELGRRLALQDTVDVHPNTIISSVPYSGNSYSKGYQQGMFESRKVFVPLSDVYHRRRTGRSFIHPSQTARDKIAQNKIVPIPHNIAGRIIILTDDTIVRGTTIRRRIHELKKLGAVEVHVRIGYGPIRAHCPHGIDIKTEKELLSTGRDVDEMRKYIEADSLLFSRHDDVIEAHMALAGVSMKPAEYKRKILCMHCADCEDPLKRLYAED